MKNMCRSLTVLALSAVIFIFSGAAVPVASHYAYKTLFVYQFTRYIQWPNRGNDIVIGVLDGNNSILSLFKEMAEKKSGNGHRITVKNFLSENNIGKCQILFVPEEKSNQLRGIVAKLANSPVLIVTEKDGLAEKGSCINFKIIGSKLKFELNQANINKAGLKVPKQLLNLAILV